MEQIHSFLVEPGVTSIGNYACFALTHLEEVFLPDSVFHIGENAFGFCPVLQSIYIPDKLESIGEWCFKGCQSLTDCVLPEYLTTIGLNAFSFCESLSSVFIPKSVTLIDAGAFSACYSLDAFHIDSENPTYTAIDGIIFSKDGLTLLEWPAGRGGSYTVHDEVTAIGDSAFLNTDGLTSVTLPASLTGVGSSVFCIVQICRRFMFLPLSIKIALSTPVAAPLPLLCINSSKSFSDCLYKAGLSFFIIKYSFQSNFVSYL